MFIQPHQTGLILSGKEYPEEFMRAFNCIRDIVVEPYKTQYFIKYRDSLKYHNRSDDKSFVYYEYWIDTHRVMRDFTIIIYTKNRYFRKEEYKKAIDHMFLTMKSGAVRKIVFRSIKDGSGFALLNRCLRMGGRVIGISKNERINPSTGNYEDEILYEIDREHVKWEIKQ